jgi:hypothetical protein
MILLERAESKQGQDHIYPGTLCVCMLAGEGRGGGEQGNQGRCCAPDLGMQAEGGRHMEQESGSVQYL